MRLSIIIPVYNVEAYVGKTLASVFDTTAPTEDFEVIVVNDGTKDGSMEVVRQFAERPNITIIDQENQGLSAARMNGWAVARGEYVWFIDSDDYLVEDGVAKVLDLLAGRPEAQVLMFPIIRKDGEDACPDFRVEREMLMAGKSIVKDPNLPEASVTRYVLKRSLMENPWIFFPKELIHEDNYFGIVLLYLTDPVHVMPDPVYVHIVDRPGSIMNTLTKRSFHDMVAIRGLLDRFMRETLDPSEWPWLRTYTFRKLLYCFERVPASGIDKDGLNLWRAWREAYPESTWKTKVKWLLYCVMPEQFRRFRS